ARAAAGASAATRPRSSATRSQLLDVEAVAFDGSHADSLVQTHRTGRVLFVDLQSDASNAATVEPRERVPQQRLAETAASSGAGHGEILDPAFLPRQADADELAACIRRDEPALGIEAVVVRHEREPVVVGEGNVRLVPCLVGAVQQRTNG